MDELRESCDVAPWKSVGVIRDPRPRSSRGIPPAFSSYQFGNNGDNVGWRTGAEPVQNSMLAVCIWQPIADAHLNLSSQIHRARPCRLSNAWKTCSHRPHAGNRFLCQPISTNRGGRAPFKVPLPAVAAHCPSWPACSMSKPNSVSKRPAKWTVHQTSDC